MSRNPTFVQALADATQRPVEVSPVLEATTLGAAFLAGLAAAPGPTRPTWPPPGRPARWWSRWHRSTGTAGPRRRRRAGGWFPDLSALDF